MNWVSKINVIFIVVIFGNLASAQLRESIMIDQFSSTSLDELKSSLLEEYDPIAPILKGSFMLKSENEAETCLCNHYTSIGPNSDSISLFFCNEGPRPISLFYRGVSLDIIDNKEYRKLIPFIHTTRVSESVVYWHSDRYSNYVVVYLEPRPTTTNTPRVALLVNLDTKKVLPIYTNQYSYNSPFPRLLQKHKNLFYVKYSTIIEEDENGKRYKRIAEVFLYGKSGAPPQE